MQIRKRTKIFAVAATIGAAASLGVATPAFAYGVWGPGAGCGPSGGYTGCTGNYPPDWTYYPTLQACELARQPYIGSPYPTFCVKSGDGWIMQPYE